MANHAAPIGTLRQSHSLSLLESYTTLPRGAPGGDHRRMEAPSPQTLYAAAGQCSCAPPQSPKPCYAFACRQAQTAKTGPPPRSPIKCICIWQSKLLEGTRL